MLREGSTYLEIADKTGASTATISRVNRSLNYGNDGYDMVFSRLKESGQEETAEEAESQPEAPQEEREKVNEEA